MFKSRRVVSLVSWTCALVAGNTAVLGDPPQSKTPVRGSAPEVAPAAILAATTPLPPKPAANAALTREQMIELAKSDPDAVWRLGKERYGREVRDYGCTFVKRELVNGKLREEEEIDVRFREAPQSVFMFWKRGTDQVKRALYVDSADFRDKKGQKVAKVEPAGAIVRLVVSEVEMPIHGKEAKEASRRTIDEFGFRNTFRIIEKVHPLAEKNGVLDFRYDGEDKIDGRPTYRFVRHLPYTGENGVYPDARMVMHLDQEWLLPTAVHSFADREGKKLLGSYVFKNVRLNQGFTERDFQF
jgi:hypothetical protein